jgi:GNAT superfamily N-acetyltransferase
MKIVPCQESDVPAIFEIVNQAAAAYRGAIPPEHWHEPYMSRVELDSEIQRGVRFFGCHVDDRLAGVMGIEPVKDVTLIRHAYIRPEFQRQGIGQALLRALTTLTDRSVLIGTWKDATWAIRFYEKNGFALVPAAETKALLDRYWAVSDRQKKASVVLVDSRWRARGAANPPR